MPSESHRPDVRRRLLALGLLAALLVAGCAGPLGTPAPTPTPNPGTPAGTPTPAATSTPFGAPATPSSAPNVTVEGGELAVDEDRVFARVLALTDRSVAPPTVEVTDLRSRKGARLAATPIHGMLGIERVRVARNRSTGLTGYGGRIRFDPSDDPADVERRLAHEYVHVVQFRTGMVRRPATYRARRSTDFTLAWRAMVEGGAVYVTDAYVDGYMPGARRQSAVFADAYASPATPGSRLALGPYHFGGRYVASRAGSPADLADAYRPFPNTTEQVVHRRLPGEEPPRALSVGSETDREWVARASDRAGELFVRAVLRVELNRSRAAAAAGGWGNDRWRTYADEGGARWGLAWVLRWDSAAEADEFEAAARTYAERRRAGADGAFRVERASDETVVAFVGHRSFVGNATVAGDDGEFTVEVG